MLGRSVMLAAAWPTSLSYRSSAETNNGFSTINKPAGIAVGDLVIITSDDDTIITTDSGSAWTKDVSAQIYYKILDATDVANTWSSSVANFYMLAVAYSNAGKTIQSAVVRSSASAGPAVTSITVPGFALSGSGKPRQVIAVVAAGSSGNVPVAPTGFTLRVTDPNSPVAGFADAQQSYTGQDVTWTGLSSGIFYGAFLFEVH